jgi:hypothetical protein
MGTQGRAKIAEIKTGETRRQFQDSIENRVAPQVAGADEGDVELR